MGGLAMSSKVIWYATVHSDKKDELVRVLQEEVAPQLARDPDFVGIRVFLRIFGGDMGRQLEFEFRTYEKAAQMMVDPDIRKLLVPHVVSLLNSNRAELLLELGS
jgi:hypothetical protein